MALLLRRSILGPERSFVTVGLGAVLESQPLDILGMVALGDAFVIDAASFDLKLAARERAVVSVPMLVRVARVAVLPRHGVVDTSPALVAGCPSDLDVLVVDAGKLEQLVARQAALRDEDTRAGSTRLVNAFDAPTALERFFLSYCRAGSGKMSA